MNGRPVQLDQQEQFVITQALAGYIAAEGSQHPNVRHSAAPLGLA